MFGDIISAVFAVAGTICVILLTYYVSRWYAGKLGTAAGGRHIRILDRVPVSKGGSLLIVELQGKQYLTGVSEHGIQLLKELEEPVSAPEPSGLPGLLKKTPAGEGSFAEILKKWKRTE